jgi:hypothetical protein
MAMPTAVAVFVKAASPEARIIEMFLGKNL